MEFGGRLFEWLAAARGEESVRNWRDGGSYDLEIVMPGTLMCPVY